MHMTTPQQRWSSALVAVSVIGTLLACLALILDGWVDALSLYVVCVLMLALMLNQFAGQRMQPRPGKFADDSRAGPGGPAGLVLTGAPGVWTGADRAAIPATLGSAASTD